MDWSPIGQRAGLLPLILAGPIVRRVEPAGVTVWVALQSPDTVRLTVLQGATVVATNGTGDHTIALGDRLHVVAVTARPPVGAPLQSAVTYSYQMEFALSPLTGAANFDAALGGSLASLVYPGGAPGSESVLPSFVLPPQTLSAVRIVHTGCRKAHGETVDALPLLDGLLATARLGATDEAFAAARPQQLVLTGDQTYNDDVAEAMLAMCIDAAGWLMGSRTEPPPRMVGRLSGVWKADDWTPMPWRDVPGSAIPWSAASPWPGVGRRGRHAYAAGLTVAAPHHLIATEETIAKVKPFLLNPTKATPTNPKEPDWALLGTFSAARNQLMLLGEFYAMTLLAYSPVLWQATQPGTSRPLPYIGDRSVEQWVASAADASQRGDRKGLGPVMDLVRAFGAGTAHVRRALANVATYMIFDDHDVCDDWYMNREWCARVLQLPGDTLGRRVVRNALISYAVMQAWGNDPSSFRIDPPRQPPPGADLLARLDAGEEMTVDLAVPRASPSVSDRVGMPTPLAPSIGAASTALLTPAGALSWHYTWAPAGWPYELIVLDTRTQRGYAPGGLEPPILVDDGWSGLRPNQLDVQIPAPDHPPGGGPVSVVVVQTPLLGPSAVERLQHVTSPYDVFDRDAEVWSLSRRAFEGLVSRLAAHNPHTVLLSGDVHYALAMSLDYAADYPWNAPASLGSTRTARIVQLTSSSAHNETSKTRLLHAVTRVVSATSGVSACGTHALPPDSSTLTTKERQPPAVFVPTRWTQLYLKQKPDWRYVITPAEGTLSDQSTPAPPSLSTSLRGAAAQLAGYIPILGSSTDGKNVVGVNNLSVVGFSGTSVDDGHAVQTVYWRAADRSGESTTPSRTTTFDVPLQYHPLPDLPVPPSLLEGPS